MFMTLIEMFLTYQGIWVFCFVAGQVLDVEISRVLNLKSKSKHEIKITQEEEMKEKKRNILSEKKISI